MNDIHNATKAIEALNLLTYHLQPIENGNHAPEQNLSVFDMFTCFPKLAFELRRAIWKHTLPGRRVVNLIPFQHSNCSSIITPGPPVALFVNKESREVAREEGSWSVFDFEYDDGFVHNRKTRPISFNPRIDVPFILLRKLMWGESWASQRQPIEQVVRVFDSVKCLEIHDMDLISIASLFHVGSEELGNPFDGTLLDQFRSLEKLVLVAKQESEYWKNIFIDRDIWFAVHILSDWFHKKHKTDGRSIPKIILNYHRYPHALTDKERNALQIPYPWLQQSATSIPANATTQSW